MGDTRNTISPKDLSALIGTVGCPLLIDARRRPAYEQAERVIAGSRWRDIQVLDDWAAALPDDRPVVVYCVHGHNVSQAAASWLRAVGRDARVLAGGFEGFADAGGVTLRRAALPAHDADRPSHWVTAGDINLNRLACAWLIRRFADPRAVFHWVEADHAAAVAADIRGVLFAQQDAGDAEPDHGFAALLRDLDLRDQALVSLASLLRDTGPRDSGLDLIAAGLSVLHGDVRDSIEQALPLLDALFAALRSSPDTGGWAPS